MQERIEPGSVVSANEVDHWDLLDSSFEMCRINHSEAYSHGGARTNLAECYFSRCRRMTGRQHLR
ncbi:transposase, partial [Cutibacterium acnes subsp. acnes]|nr:transposase [Cutibacterium acnes subsp. acnes]